MIKESEALPGFNRANLEGLKQAYYPWRRYLARSLDISVYSTIFDIFLMLVLHVNMANRSSMGKLFDIFVSIAIMLFLEPLWLHLFRTTPGKAIFSLKIVDFHGNNLTYSEGLERTWGVMGSGMGYNIPIYNIVRAWKSYKLCKENETQPWDVSLTYTIKDTKWYRGLILISAYVVIIVISLTATSLQQLPPNRGDLTVSEFVDNFNYYSHYLDIDFGDSYLDENGEWSKKAYYGRSKPMSAHETYISMGYNEMPEYEFIIENGYLTGISFLIELRNNEEQLHSYSEQMILAALSFAGAQEETGLFSNVLTRTAKQITDHRYKDFDFTVSGMEVACNVEYTGYNEFLYFLIPNTTENYFKLQFSMNKDK